MKLLAIIVFVTITLAGIGLATGGRGFQLDQIVWSVGEIARSLPEVIETGVNYQRREESQLPPVPSSEPESPKPEAEEPQVAETPATSESETYSADTKADWWIPPEPSPRPSPSSGPTFCWLPEGCGGWSWF